MIRPLGAVACGAFVATLLASTACSLILGLDEAKERPGAGGASSATSTTGTGGAGGAPECMEDRDCDDANPCTTDICDATQHTCAQALLPDGPPPGVPDPPKNCRKPSCVGGALTQVPDDLDLPTDGNPCTNDMCKNGVPSHVNLPVNTSCGTLLCNANGVCVGCTAAGQCPTISPCKAVACTNQKCIYSNKAAGAVCETVKVCDGADNCVACVTDSQCPSGNKCVANTCAP